MRTLLTVGLFTVLTLAGQTRLAAQDDATAIIARAIKAHGGAEALNKTKTASTKSQGTMMVFGQEVAFVSTSIYAVPDRFKMEMAAEIRGLKLNATQVVNGKQVNVKTMLGGMEQPANDKVKEETYQAVLIQEVTSLTPLVEGKKYTLKAEPEAKVEDKPAVVVLVTAPGLKDIRLSFDKESGRLVKTERKALASSASGLVEVKEESFLSDFKEKDGALLPMKLVVKHDGKPFMSVNVTEIKLLDKVDASDFTVEK